MRDSLTLDSNLHLITNTKRTLYWDKLMFKFDAKVLPAKIL